MSSHSEPNVEWMNKVSEAMKALEVVDRPVFLGLDNIPDERPLLFVGNHTLYGMECPHLMAKLVQAKGIYLRGLGDLRHWRTPIGKFFFDNLGAVPGTPENCSRLMAEGECILVFPGGAWEVFRGRDQQFDLLWRKRMGFARLAIQHGCTIVPFGAVGADEAFDIRMDRQDYLRSPFGALLRRLNVPEDIMMPVVSGIGKTPIPKPARLYYGFGEPIPTREFLGQEGIEEVVWGVRERTRLAVAQEINRLREFRETDPERKWSVRLQDGLRSLVLATVR